MIYLSAPHMSPKEREYLLQAFDSNWVAPLGPFVDRFEKQLAEKVGVAGAVALSSGTAALHLGLLVLGVKPGDYVITSTMTFVATANAIAYTGAIPVFVDVLPDTWNMDPVRLEETIETLRAEGKHIGAIVPVDLYGNVSKIPLNPPFSKGEEIPPFSKGGLGGISVLEDAAEALGSVGAGTQGDLGVFSFNGNKILTTGGGGALVGNDLELLAKARYLSTQARLPAPYYQHEELGFNYRLSNLLAAVGCGQLEVLEERVARRREIHLAYRRELENIIPWDVQRSNCWLTCMYVDNPDAVIKHLNAHQIEARRVWKPMHLQPLYKHARVFGGSVSEQIFKSAICLPSGSSLSDSEQNFVISKIREIIELETDDGFDAT